MTGTAIRAALPADAGAIRALLTEVFGGPGEAALVEVLRSRDEIVLEQCAVAGGQTVGYVACARLAGAPLSPVSSPAERGEAKGTHPSTWLGSTGPHIGHPLGAGDIRGGIEAWLPSLRSAGDDTDRNRVRIAALAPLAVAVPWRRRGIGEALVRGSLEVLRANGCALVLVLGDPAYYRRFGFVPAADFGLSTPYDGPHQQALALGERGGAARSLRVIYPDAFAGLE